MQVVVPEIVFILFAERIVFLRDVLQACLELRERMVAREYGEIFRLGDRHPAEGHFAALDLGLLGVELQQLDLHEDPEFQRIDVLIDIIVVLDLVVEHLHKCPHVSRRLFGRIDVLEIGDDLGPLAGAEGLEGDLEFVADVIPHLFEEEKEAQLAVANLPIQFGLFPARRDRIVVVVAFDEGKLHAAVEVDIIELTDKIAHFEAVKL